MLDCSESICNYLPGKRSEEDGWVRRCTGEDISPPLPPPAPLLFHPPPVRSRYIPYPPMNLMYPGMRYSMPRYPVPQLQEMGPGTGREGTHKPMMRHMTVPHESYPTMLVNAALLAHFQQQQHQQQPPPHPYPPLTNISHPMSHPELFYSPYSTASIGGASHHHSNGAQFSTPSHHNQAPSHHHQAPSHHNQAPSHHNPPPCHLNLPPSHLNPPPHNQPPPSHLGMFNNLPAGTPATYSMTSSSNSGNNNSNDEAGKKLLSCYNCGQLGHLGAECPEASIEEMTRRATRIS